MLLFRKHGKLALEHTGKRLPLTVMHCENGFYIGTFDDDGPVSRESEMYYVGKESADNVLKTFSNDLQLSSKQLG